jgi:iron complex outermembrane receptor protein
MTPPSPKRLIASALCATLAVVAAAPAAAQGRVRVFRLPSEPVEQAVLRFALQGDVSVGWTSSGACRGRSRPVQGAMTPVEALARLLPDGCQFESVDPRTYRIVGEREASARRGSTAASVRPPSGANPAPLAEELVVTAEKRAEPLIASPFPVSALSGPELSRLGGASFQAVAAQVVGVAATNLGPGRNKIFIRGLSDGSFTGLTQSTVGLYLDEAPITYNAPDPALRLVDVERIEVLRGPQGSLYGSGSIGGIIRIVTNKPDPGRFSAWAAVEGGLTQRGGASGAAELVVNAPLPHGAAVRLVAYDESAGGYIDNLRRRAGDVNRTRRQGVRVSLAVPAGDWRLLLSGVHQEIDNADTQYALGGSRLTRYNRMPEPHDNNISVLSLDAGRTLSWSELRLTATAVEHHLHTHYDATNSFDVTGPAAFEQSQRVRMLMGQAELASLPGGRAHWLVGLFAARAHQPQGAVLAAPLTAGVRSIYHRDDDLTEASAYGEFAYDLTPRLKATLGGRLFISWLRHRAEDFELEPRARPRRFDMKDRGFAPKLRLSYAAAPDRVVYVQAQEGFRTGGFNLPLSVVGLQPGESYRLRFRPDRLWSFEAGGAATLFDRALTIRAALFHADWRNVQTDQFLASGLPITVNIGDGVNTGLEVEAAWTRGPWQVRANALVDDPKITKSARIFPTRPNIGLPGVPRRMGAGDVSYRWSPAAGLTARISAQYAYVGRSYLTFEGGPAARMGGYGVGRLAADLSARAWRFAIYLDNVLDGRGDTFAFGNPFMSDMQATPLRPRTLGARIERQF